MIYLALQQTNRLGTQSPVQEAWNSLGEIEAAMTREYTAMPYMEGPGEATVHVIGFPTKYTKKGSSWATLPCASFDFDGPFFHTNTTSYRVPLYNVRVWDVNEVYSSTQIFSPSPTAGLRDEVNLLAVSLINPDAFPEGWVSYPFRNSSGSFTTTTYNAQAGTAGTNLVYTGIPAVQTTVVFGSASAGTIGGSYSIDGAWSDASVSVNGTTLPGYQGQNAYTPF
jgi:hypothetical protein